MKQCMAMALALAVASAGVLAAPPEAPKPNGKGQVILSWDEFVKITNFDPARKPESRNVLTIPWKQVKELLGVKVDVLENQTVDLPWKEFLACRAASRVTCTISSAASVFFTRTNVYRYSISPYRSTHKSLFRASCIFTIIPL